MKHKVEALIKAAVARLPPEFFPSEAESKGWDAGLSPLQAAQSIVHVERTKDVAHGDFATNIAMRLNKFARLSPRVVAQKIIDFVEPSELISKIEIAGPGFINFHLSPIAYQLEIEAILDSGVAYGRGHQGQGEKTLLEFVSANPTGPLHVGHGRQAALGDALAALMQSQGYQVTREFYYNDAGVQIQTLANSVQARLRGVKPGDAEWPEAAYNGDYIADIANDFKAGKTTRAKDGEPVTASGNVEDFDNIKHFAVAYLRNEQDLDLQSFGLTFDIYYLESSLYADGKVDATVNGLMQSGKTYEQDGALWLKTTDYGDDKDRVMRKSDGTYTYFVPDVAYHVAKWQRGFKRAINIQGSDHHSTITRVRAGLQALNIDIPQGYPDYVLHKMVKVMRGGEEVKISKRAGSYVTLRDLIEWVGRDAVRFFLVSRRADTEFVFDVDLALSQSEENPVYYVQYAHARICSVFKQLNDKQLSHDVAQGAANMQLLNTPHELALIRRLTHFPELLDAAATALEPHQIAHYLRELAGDFHTYYNAHKFVVEDAALRNARMNLVAATRQVLANGLALLGVSAPEAMNKASE